MRRLERLFALAGMLTLLASPAGAYRLIVDGPDPSGIGSVIFGDIVSWDVYLDTEGESGITLISFSRTYDPTIMTYLPYLSDANDYYPLYAPMESKSQPATWLVPNADPPNPWSGTLPPIGGQINVEFYESNLGQTVATATHLYLATLSFEVTGVGFEGGSWSFDQLGNTFTAYGVDVSDEVSWVFVPEPTTALLLGLGFAGLGVSARRRFRG